MAKPYPIVPLDWLDGFNDLNRQLLAYERSVQALFRAFQQDGSPYDLDEVLCGLHDLVRPVIEGYRSIADQCRTAESLGMVGVAQLADDAESSA
ncbi:hypothetical protein SI88_20120 [Acinetobacter baumannii]|nr:MULTISPECIES: hypothetical protein [Gammaproteobacteria]KHF51496.1 hypothetical protein LT24_04404 [Klebsiella pneumoniae]KHF52386.1 hypothetical protein LT32_04773 [Klebsiella pneumoniae subsp. pneumoniae]KHF63993.1 hypothetical protein LV59_04064 [Klebsiella pneumoniae]KYO87891.1 hypothetical protein LL05_02257 [Pseudomonas aeruginosa]NBG82960.1 hypothetical protein [Acinetobacter baumannii]